VAIPVAKINQVIPEARRKKVNGRVCRDADHPVVCMSGIAPWLCHKPGGQPPCQLSGASQVVFPPVNLSNKPGLVDCGVSLSMR
jgi:hypothetical protein